MSQTLVIASNNRGKIAELTELLADDEQPTVAFVFKVDAKGATTWVQTFGDKDHDQGRAVALDDKGDVYVSGLYRFSLAVVEPAIKQVLDAKDPVLSKAPKADIFVVKLQR